MGLIETKGNVTTKELLCPIYSSVSIEERARNRVSIVINQKYKSTVTLGNK